MVLITITIHLVFANLVFDAHTHTHTHIQVLSAGVIPVIFSDKWVLPFYEVLDYSKFAVLIKEQVFVSYSVCVCK